MLVYKVKAGMKVIMPVFEDYDIHKKNAIKTILIFLAAVILSACRPGAPTNKSEKLSETFMKVTFALPATPSASPFFVASEKGYFKQEGLDVSLNLQISGKASLESVIKGESSVAATGDIPAMFAGLSGEKIYIIASYLAMEKMYVIVARKDSGILEPGDLAGKRIGITRGTNSEFFMDTLFLYHEIIKNKHKITNYKPSEAYDALMNNKIDAVSTWHPHAVLMQRALGENQITFDGEGIYTGRFNIVVRQEDADSSTDMLEKILRATQKAITFIHEYPEESRMVIAKYIKLEKNILKEIWDVFDFKMELGQTLIITLEDEARWAIKNNLTDKTEVPNYLDYIHINALEEVDNSAVTIIR